MFRVTGLSLKILGRVHIFVQFLDGGVSNIIFFILKGISPFKMHKIILKNPENLKKILDFTSIFR